jgi:exonuclease SbcC
MILKSIRLKNFRKFKDTIVEFPDGVTGIVGLNGVGKSTIFEAVAWAMYGAVAARTSTDQIKLENADIKDPCRIELDFIFSEDNYRIVREMSGKSLSTSATVTINEKIVATGAEIVSGFIQKRFGMDFKSFYTSIFAKQKELNALSSMNPSERRPLILRMLGINSIDEIIGEIRSDIKDKKNTIKKFEIDLVDNNGVNKIEKTKIDKKEIEEKLKDIINSNSVIIKHISSLKKRIIILQKESEQNKKEFEKLNKEKEKIEEDKLEFEKKKRLQEEITDINNKIKKRQEKIKIENLKLAKFEKISQDLRNAEIKLRDNNKIMEVNLKNKEQKNTIINQINEKINNLENKKKVIVKIGFSAKCPTCDRKLGTQYEHLLKNYNNEIQTSIKKIQSLDEAVIKINKEYDKLINEKNALQKKINYLHEKIIEKEKIVALINNNTQELERERKELKDKQGKFSKISKIVYDEKTYENLKKNIDIQYEKYQSSINSYNEIRNKLERLNIQQERNVGEKKLLTQQISNIKQRIEELKNISEKVKIEKKSLQLLSILNELMNSFRTYLISQIRPTLSQYASELFNQLTDGKYSEIELDENYNLKIYDNGVPYDIDRFSGGEEDLANLCIRLAISEVITAKSGNIFNLIILDEIFGSQDNMRKQNIIHALSKFSSKFRQIFLITHVEDIKNFMENTIMVMEEENGISKIKIE